jgi:isoleucyl-tRNA synthetase
VLATFKGSCLEGCHYQHPLYERVSPLVLGGDYITTDSGTGLVHTAPGHGQEDYQVGGGLMPAHCCIQFLGCVDGSVVTKILMSMQPVQWVACAY